VTQGLGVPAHPARDSWRLDTPRTLSRPQWPIGRLILATPDAIPRQRFEHRVVLAGWRGDADPRPGKAPLSGGDQARQIAPYVAPLAEEDRDDAD
jgi:hypothetical protein